MEIDPLELPGIDESTAGARDARARRLNSWVAVTVALLATFMGICKVKDDNLVQAMQQAQADRLDHWSFYQARNIRQDVAQSALDGLLAASAAQPPAAQRTLAPVIARYQALVADQKIKKDSLRAQATQ